MKKTKWTEVEMTGVAVVGLVMGIAGAIILGPVGAVIGVVAGVVPLAWYRVATRP